MSELEKLSLVKLKQLCKSLGLKTSGKKSILIARLVRRDCLVKSESTVPDQLENVNNNDSVPELPELPEMKLSLKTICSTWFGRQVLSNANLENSTFGIRSCSNVSSSTVVGSIRFWMTRFYNLIEFNMDNWKEFEINQIFSLSSDFIVAEESTESKITLHLVLLETGQVLDSCDAISNSKLDDWKLWISQFKDSIITKVESWDTDYPNNISKRILKESREFKIASRFILAHSEGLCGGSQSLVKMKNSKALKCCITVSLDNAVVSVDDVAFIQTFGNQGIYVLTEVGWSIGTEDDGISEIWQEILGCSQRGILRDDRS